MMAEFEAGSSKSGWLIYGAEISEACRERNERRAGCVEAIRERGELRGNKQDRVRTRTCRRLQDRYSDTMDQH